MMVLDDEEIRRWARQLDESARGGQAMDPVAASVEGLDASTGYAIQRELIGLRLARGERIAGAKAGLTSEAKQQQMGVHEPIYGWLTDAMEVDPGRGVRIRGLIHPRVEPEIVFVLGRPLEQPDVSTADVLDGTKAVCCGLEILDSRYRDFRFSLPDVVADNTSAAGFVIGDTKTAPKRDLAAVQVELRVNGDVVGAATGAAVLGNPAEAVARLARFAIEQGRPLQPGWVVLSGGLTDAVAVSEGDRLELVTDGLGTLSTTVVP